MEDKETAISDPKLVGVQYSFSEIDEREVDFRHYLLALLNRRWMILTITILVVVGTTIYSFLKMPTYRAKAIIDISPPTMYLVLPDTVSQSVLRADSFVNTQLRMLESRDLAKNVAKRLNLTLKDVRADGFKKPDSRDDELADIASVLLKMLKTVSVPGTNLCEIIFITPNPKLSMTLANGWAQQYVEQRLDSMQQYTQKAEELLLNQVKALQQGIEEKEKLLHDYSLEKQIFKVGKDSIASEAVSSLNHQLASARQDRITAEIRYQAVTSANKETIPEVQSHPSVAREREEYLRLQSDYAEKSRTYKSDYPEMIRLRSQLEQFQKTLAPAIEDAYQSVLATARGEYQAALIKENAVLKQFEEAKRQSLESGQKEMPYDQLVMDIDNKKQLLDLLLQKQNQTNVSADVQAQTTPASRIMEMAEFPKQVYSPNIKKNILLSFLAGLAASIGLGLLFEFFDRSLKTPEDVERHIQLPFLGIVPYYIPEGNGNGNHHKTSNKALAPRGSNGSALDRYTPYRLSNQDAASSASEAVKTVRTSLLLAFPGAPPRSILVTSSRAGEGKTFIACNLAIALTQLEKRVVIVDADMRNPHVHKVWDLSNSKGLSIYLTSDATAASVITATPLNKLYLMCSGPKTPRPAELLASTRFEELLKYLEKEYDFVILDSPPVLPVTDSIILASRVKSVLMVVRGGATPREVVKMAKKKLLQSNGVIAGTVLNGIDMADPYYYYRYYSDYYSSYYGENVVPRDTDQ